jgi:uncharacterized membrane protein (DUF485 family)
MLHKPAAPTGKDPASGYKTVVGLWMFLVYALVYAGFVALSVTKPTALGIKVIFGLNLAVVYGIGLIALALLMAVIYNVMCMKRERKLAGSAGEREVR